MSVRSPRPDQHDEGDEDASLFGSPPPSPGRSPSPALALPLRSNDGSNDNSKSGPSPLPHEVSTLANLNVGTIALPGSQPSSELFVNPLAPSLASLPTPTSLVNNAHRRTGSQSTTTSTGSSRTRQSTSTTAKPPRAKKRKVKSTTPRPQVQIPLPDPSGPVPPHFLRSQTGLLGLAGLVGGVNPSQLKLRGQTPTNPIVVEDEEGGSTAAPSVTKPPPKKKSRLVPGLSKEMRMLLKAAKPSEIPVPTKQDILAVLVKERDLTPIIQGLIKLGMDAQGRVAPSPQPVPPAPKEESSAFDGRPPAKKRRLSIVPAGANDWDVPYPFPEGQGPTSYQGSWKTERGKQLIDQLIELTKVASKKAAVQKFLKVKGIQLSNQAAQKSSAEVEIVNGHYKSRGQPPPPVVPTPTEGRINKYYKPITATYGLGVQRPPFPVAGSLRQSTPAASSSASQPHPKSSGASKQQRSSPPRPLPTPASPPPRKLPLPRQNLHHKRSRISYPLSWVTTSFPIGRARFLLHQPFRPLLPHPSHPPPTSICHRLPISPSYPVTLANPRWGWTLCRTCLQAPQPKPLWIAPTSIQSCSGLPTYWTTSSHYPDDFAPSALSRVGRRRLRRRIGI
ncbi:hypothetical protein BKA70DRAFT_1261904 [Coprinopsis sp. MPI-PUGE-AT-0042]|nr:hypothetical protein BKA70DRAFT_1261904 [Coprinopsis sp. MPI-PUGE-AT-0042]